MNNFKMLGNLKEFSVPKFLNDMEANQFYERVGCCGDNSGVLIYLESINRRLEKYNLEIILYNDGSTDYLFDVVEKGFGEENKPYSKEEMEKILGKKIIW